MPCRRPLYCSASLCPSLHARTTPPSTLSPQNGLALQAWLLILIVLGILVGSISLFLDRLPHAALLQHWWLSSEGGIAVLLASAGLLALARQHRMMRSVLALLMLAVALYGLGQYMLAAPHDRLAPVTAYRGLHPLPAGLLVLAAVGYLLPAQWRLARPAWRLIGGVAIMTGALTLGMTLFAAIGTDTSSTAGFSPVGSLFAALLGSGFLIVARHAPDPALTLPRTALVAGTVGVTLSLAVWLTSGWVQHHERLDAADKLAANVAKGFVQRLSDRVHMLERLTERWEAQDGLPDSRLRNVEARTYLSDEPSLKAMAYLAANGAQNWRIGRSTEDLQWLMAQLAQPATQSWLHRQNELSSTTFWRFPDPERPYLGLLAITLNGGVGTMLATLDMRDIVQLQAHVDTGGFTLHFMLDSQPWATLSDRDWSNSITPQTFAARQIPLPGGPVFTLTVLDGPMPLSSLEGTLPFIFGLLGLLFSHQLILSRALLAVRAAQAQALDYSEQRFRSLFTRHPDAAFAYNLDGAYTAINPITEAIVGVPEHKLLGRHFRTLICEPACSKADIRRTEAAFRHAASGRTDTYTLRFWRDARTVQDLEVVMVPIIVNGTVDGVFGIAKDISARVSSEERMRVLERSVEASSNAIVILDARTAGYPVAYINPAFTAITGHQKQDVLGRPPHALTGHAATSDIATAIRQTIEQGETLTTTFRAHKADGSPYWNQLLMSPVRDADQGITHFVGIMTDVTEHREQERKLAYQATHDALTGLANRALFSERLSQDVDFAARKGRTVAVLFIDLDGFKPINDTLGHKVGDELLVSVARILTHSLRTSDTLARLGGDEFVLLLPDLNTPEEAEDVAGRLLDELNKPHRVGPHELHISASIGIATHTGPLHEPEELLQHADMAMYKAKQQGRNAWERYTVDLDSRQSGRVTLRTQLQEAIEQHQLSLHYQPLLDRHGRVESLEALVRWHHPTEGVISPGVFIPLAEETGQIIALSRWVMRQACQDACRLVDEGLLHGRMAVNLSPLQFHRANFLTALRDTLAATGLSARHLELELTEGILMHDTGGAIDTLNALRGMGVSTAIDDFGTGFSSLSYLRDLPIDKIKIDRSFVTDVATSDKDAAICRSVITLARDLNLKIVAEGVETEEQHGYLLSLGCHTFQGYLFAKPMPLEMLMPWLAQRAESVGTSPSVSRPASPEPSPASPGHLGPGARHRHPARSRRHPAYHFAKRCFRISAPLGSSRSSTLTSRRPASTNSTPPCRGAGDRLRLARPRVCRVLEVGRARHAPGQSPDPEITMTLASTLLLAFAMSTDAFAAAIGKGAALQRPHFREALRTGLIFGTIEATTPVIGWAMGMAASRYVAEWDHWIAFTLLLLLGGHMIKEGFSQNDDEADERPTQHSFLRLALTGFATSIDAMAVGVGLAFVDVNIVSTAAFIGLATLTMVTLGVMLGRVLGHVVGQRAEIVGGVILIGIGTLLLMEHLGMLA
ncbi:MAG: sensory box/ EAL domain/GGDEF domain containing protein [Halomonadaceae bacterium T82-2]|nr:MAG: sensory box/ EAL domain/GGDEF domain containing protein [Halomonadaceae bacterium T82-2]